MALLHLKQLYVGTIVVTTGTGTNVITVPAGSRYVVREIDFRNLSSTTAFSLLAYVDGILVWSQSLAASASGQWDGWIVLNPGQTFNLRVGLATGMGVVVSGSVYTV